MIVGLGYRMMTGKDTVAKTLVRDYGFTRVAFADPLKDAAAAIFGFHRLHLDYADYKAEVDPYWGVTRRSVLQKLGTECLRKGYADDVWVRAAHRRVAEIVARGGSVVLTDVRFLNEVEAVRSWGGVVWKIERASAPVHAHISEVELHTYDKWDRVIDNDGTFDELDAKIEEAFRAT